MARIAVRGRPWMVWRLRGGQRSSMLPVMPGLTRRDFIGTCAIAVTAARAEAAATHYVYVYESWAPDARGSPFVVGFLVTREPEQHLRALRSLQKRTRFERAMRYRTTDTYKVGCARAFVQYFSENHDLRFVARIVDPGAAAIPATDDFRRAQYADLCTAAALPPGAIVRMKQRKRWRRAAGADPDQKVIEEALTKGLQPTRVESVPRAAKDSVLGLGNLLNGTLFGAWANRTQPYRLHPVKAAVVERLEGLLDLASLDRAVSGKWEPTNAKL